ncbi:MAG: hypothetical protein AB8H86_01590 [Polyangiales bacterium]
MRFAFVLGVVSMLAGCSVLVCPDCYEDGEPLDATTADTLDAGPDLSEPDAASACVTECSAPTPHCDEGSATCVACVEDEHCPGAGVCRNGRCPECLDNTECTTAEAPVCSESGPTAGQCVPCVSRSGCEGVRVSGVNLDACELREDEPNICVACNGGDAAECGGRVCDVRARECTEMRTNMARTCEPCVASSECRDGGVCAQEVFAGAPTGFYCFPPTSTGCVVPRVYERDLWESVEGPDAEVCHPASTTCQGLRDETEPCADSSTCGLPGVNDAVCVEGIGRCTYLCGGDFDCQGEQVCPIDDPQICIDAD